MLKLLEKHSASILTFLGTAGVVGTAILTGLAVPKAISIIKDAEEEKGEALSISEQVISTYKVYIPAVLLGAGTISCVLGANILNKTQQASLASSYALLNEAFKKYRNGVKNAYGDEEKVHGEMAKTHIQETDEPVSGEYSLFFDPYGCRSFESTMEAVKDAVYHLNRNFQLRGNATLNEFYSFLQLPETEYGALVGWDYYVGETEYGYLWIDIAFSTVTLEDGLEIYNIEFPFAPTVDCVDNE